MKLAHSVRKGGSSLLTVGISSLCFACFVHSCVRTFERQHLSTLSKGEIVSCVGPLLYLWTMKGQLLASTGTSSGPQADILCVSFTQQHEWDSRNVIVTGCTDGIIRVSSLYLGIVSSKTIYNSCMFIYI